MSYNHPAELERQEPLRPTGGTGENRVVKANTPPDSKFSLNKIKHLPPTEFPRMDGESNEKAARRLLDVWDGCYGD